jgi:hypothetical protein
VALPTFDQFRDRLCGDEFGCTYEESPVEFPPGSKKYITAGVFRRKGKIPTFVRDNIGAVVDPESICSITGRLGIADPASVARRLPRALTFRDNSRRAGTTPAAHGTTEKTVSPRFLPCSARWPRS